MKTALWVFLAVASFVGGMYLFFSLSFGHFIIIPMPSWCDIKGIAQVIGAFAILILTLFVIFLCFGKVFNEN